MKFKGTMAAILSATLLCTAAVAATTANQTPVAPPDTVATEQQVPLSVMSQQLQVIEVVTETAGVYPYITAAPVDDTGKADPAQAIRLNLSADTVYLDTQTGLAAGLTDLAAGDEIFAYYSPAMTRSIPPQTACFAIVMNLDEKAAPAHYLTAEQVTENEDGSVTVLAENGTIFVTVGADTPISPYKTKNIVKNTDLTEGARFFAWYDIVALSMPGQAQATRAVLLPELTAPAAADAPAARDGDSAPLEPGESTPYRFGAQATVTEVQTKTVEDDMVFVSALTLETADGRALVANIGEHTAVLDTQTGLPATAADIKPEDSVYVYYGATMTASEPAQVAAQAVLVNLDEAHAPAHLLTAESVTTNPGGGITLLADGGSVLVTVGADAAVTAYKTRETLRNTDIHMGTQLFAWYDVVAESHPAQAGTARVVVLPPQDSTLTMITGGDIAIGEARVENGVVMVPLRQVAENLGFTVTWNGETRSVHLTNNKVQTNIQLGLDAYYKSTAIEGALGLTASFPLGAAAYEQDGTTWAPAEVFNLLLGERVVRLHGDVLYV